MGLLEAVMQKRAQDQQAAQFQQQLGTQLLQNAMETNRQMKQQEFANQVIRENMANQRQDRASELALARENQDISLAKAGLKRTANGFEKDPSLQDSLEEVTKQAKLKNVLGQIEARDQATSILDQFSRGDMSSVPPGTTLKAGPLTIPLNPKLTESEQSAVAGATSMRPTVNNIINSVNSGVFGTDSIGRTFKQFLVDRASGLSTSLSNKELQNLQGDLNELKKTLPFTEGGKQLTNTEKAIVFSLLNVTGKSNERITKDLNAAIKILEKKKALALGGANAAGEGEDIVLNEVAMAQNFDVNGALAEGYSKQEILEYLKNGK